MTDPLENEATDPLENEANHVDTVEITWRDHTFTTPADINKLPMGVLNAFEHQRAYAAAAIILGPDQLATMEKAGATVEDLGGVMEQWAEAVGLTVGE